MSKKASFVDGHDEIGKAFYFQHDDKKVYFNINYTKDYITHLGGDVTAGKWFEEILFSTKKARKNILDEDAYDDKKFTVKLIKLKNNVSEGFLSKTINRAKTGEERKEDVIDSNIDSLDEIDLGFPFLIADIDFELGNGTNAFTWYEVLSYLDHIHSKGWRLMEFDEIRRYIVGNKKTIDILHNQGCVDVKNKKTQEVVRFRFDRSLDSCSFNWWVGCSKSGHPRSEPENSSYANTLHNNSYSHPTLGIKQKSEFAQLRLVKDKNIPVKEGFLSKTINRSKTGEQRLEDKLPPNNLKDLKPVDLGLSFLIADDVLTIDTEKIRREKFFKKEDVFKYVDNIEKTGWRLPSVKEVEELQKFKNVEYTADFTHVDFIGDNSKLSFNFMIHDFFIHDEKQVYDGDNGIGRVQFSKFYDKQNFMKICGCVDTEYCTFRLIKDKR